MWKIIWLYIKNKENNDINEIKKDDLKEKNENKKMRKNYILLKIQKEERVMLNIKIVILL